MTIRTLRRLSVALVLALAPAAAAAQEAPEALAQRYFATMKAGDWATNATLMHPEAISAIHTLFTKLVQTPQGAADVAGMRQMLGVGSAAEVQALSGEQMYARLMANVAGQSLGDVLRDATVQVIGTVPEAGTDNAFVVYRMTMTMMGTSITQTQTMPLKRDNGVWKVMLTANLEQLVQQLETILEP